MIANYETLRRTQPDSQSCLIFLLLKHKGTHHVYAEYNMWLNSQGCGLQHSLHECILDLETLSLAIAVEARERWGKRYATRPRSITV